MKTTNYILLLLIAATIASCKVQYGFTQPKSVNADTFQVNRIENNALLIEPGLERDFKIALEDLIQDQTNYTLVPSNGDLIYEGEITQYRVSPTTATADDRAAQNRLTIGVKIRFYNTNNEEDDVEKSFSFFYDYPGSAQLVGGQKVTAHEEIFERLTQDIINATLAKW